VPLERSQLYMCTGRQQQERCRGYGPSRRRVGQQSCNMRQRCWPFLKKACVTAAAQFVP
jgi:hypothetical protein